MVKIGITDVLLSESWFITFRLPTMIHEADIDFVLYVAIL